METLKKYHKYVVFVTLGLFSLAFLTCFINLMSMIKDLNIIKDSNPPIEVYKMFKVPWNIILSMTIFAMLAIVFAFIALGFKQHADKIRIAVDAASFFFAVGAAVSNSYLLSVVVPELGSEPFASTIAFIIFMFIAAIMAVIDIVVMKKYPKYIYLTGIGLALFLIIGNIINLAGADPEMTTGAAVTEGVFYLFFSFALIPYFITYREGDLDVNAFVSAVPSSAASVQSQKRLNAVADPSEELMKLKKLKDEGILTEEEYNQKKQKYIDML